MLNKKKFNKILREKIKDIWLFRLVSLFFGLFILFYLYKNEIIAVVFINGQAISFTEIAKIYSSTDKENMLDKIISEKIIENEAKKRNIEVSKEEIESELLIIEKEAIENGMTMAQLLKEIDKTARDLEKEVRLKIIIYKILSEDIELSEKEIDEYIQNNPELYDNLSEEEIREDVRKLLIDVHINEKYKTWIKQAKASSEIKYIIK